MEYAASDIFSLLRKGESDILEYKRHTSPTVLTKLITAFANSNGGLILVGVGEDPRHYSEPTVVGTNPAKLKRQYELALEKITPQPKTFLSNVAVDGKTVCVISVEKSEQLILSDEGAFNRVGQLARIMSPSSILQAMKQDDGEAQLEVMATSISQLTQRVEEVKAALENSGGWRSKLIDYTLGGIIGAVIGIVITSLI